MKAFRKAVSKAVKAVSGMPFCYLGMGVEKRFESNGVRNPFDSILLVKKKLVLCSRNLRKSSWKKRAANLFAISKRPAKLVFGKHSLNLGQS